jgi:hypothetical protein
MDQLPYELRNYDFGIHALQGDVIEVQSRFAKAGHYGASFASRLSDYVDAGLRLLLSPSTGICQHHFRQFGISELWDKDFTRDPLTRLRKAKKRIPVEAVAAAREALSLERHAHRLLSFYKGL